MARGSTKRPDENKGRLGALFGSASFVPLNEKFIAGAPDRKNAEKLLQEFYGTAEEFRLKEKGFNLRARPIGKTPSLMAHLRSPDHMASLREFTQAKTALLGINPAVGNEIILLVEKKIDAPAVFSR